ncbi:MAG: hypothetical protein IKK22_05920 [Firmicutes bacterium]|nr:hypothetical protein [Bacillota bacterium]
MDNEYLLLKELLQFVPNTSEHLWLFLSAEYDETSAISKPSHEIKKTAKTITFKRLYNLSLKDKFYIPGDYSDRQATMAGLELSESERLVVYREGTRYYLLFGGELFKLYRKVYNSPKMDDNLRQKLLAKRFPVDFYENLCFESLQYLIAKYNCPERIITAEEPIADSSAQDVPPAKEPEVPAVSEEPVTSEAEKNPVDSRGLSVNILSAFILEQAKSAKELSCTVQKTAAISQNRHAGSSCIGLVSAVHRKLNNRWYWQCGPPPDLPAA